MIRLTVEEENLLSIYNTGSKRELFERVNAALPFVDGDNSVKYCPDCRKRITRKQAAERMRKRRAHVTR